MNKSVSAFEYEADHQESHNDQLDDDAMLSRAVVAVTGIRRNRRRAPQPMHNSRLTGSMRVEEILNGHEEIIQGMISMKIETFRALSNLLEEYAADCVPVSGNIDVNADYVFDDGIDGTGPSTGTQQHDSRRGAMNQMRDMMADDMWERYQSSPWYKST
ncbi:hypothetical protein TIFTF001_040401 [Ficus carica]|uniref:Uncharacterized protein n=1 Tax=Ficus carica TaxID=3494 RepID=A0AA87Z2X9_FICCA|nr:hypothetical protein TIFTF001_040401 [Ficus carica]